MIEALIYDIEVVVDATHNWKKIIKEIYVPDLCLVINSYNSFIDKSRTRLSGAHNKEAIFVDNGLASNLFKQIEKHDEIENNINLYRDCFVRTYLGDNDAKK